MKKIDRFVDPVVVMSPRPGVYWTPNGNHRRAVLGKLKAKMVPAILIPEAEVAFQILAPEISRALGVGAGALTLLIALKTLAIAISPLPTAALVQKRVE